MIDRVILEDIVRIKLDLRRKDFEGKGFAESLFTAYYKQYGLNVKIARIFNSYESRLRGMVMAELCLVLSFKLRRINL